MTQIVTVLCVRHPDSSNDFTVHAPRGIRVDVIDVDLGSSFDGNPRNEDEAEVAVEMADSIYRDTASLPKASLLRRTARGLAAELRDEGRAILRRTR